MPRKKPRLKPSPASLTPPESLTLPEALGFLLGLVLFCFGLGSLLSIVQSITWRLRTGALYQEGVCRVVSAKVTLSEGNWVLDVEHCVEIDGKTYNRTTHTEEERPTAPTKEEAEAMLTRYQVGQLYPCWYDAKDPNRHSVLLRNGLQPWQPLRWLWRCVVLGAPGFLLCLWLWNRRCARERARTTAPGTPIS